MGSEAKVILKSVNIAGVELTTIQLRYWRAIHGELMTHRAFSRNAGSSRATPVKKMLAQVWSDPAGPIHWGTNKAGMQAGAEVGGWRLTLAKTLWKLSGRAACVFAWTLMKVGLHKQVANRILEPWQYINVLVSATDWDNFYGLRCHPDAQPEFQELAEKVREVISTAPAVPLQNGRWHLPYILPQESFYTLETKLKLSAARCARISIAPFDGDASVKKECERHDLLVGSTPIHASPTEHQAEAASDIGQSKNFRGFIQYRYYVENKDVMWPSLMNF